MDTLTGHQSRLTKLSRLQSLCLHDQDYIQTHVYMIKTTYKHTGHISHCMLTDEQFGND